ncbi:GNAT family N-acetyltransferase [Actinacidiphila acidipaludis]|uniref:GNAT family N-acetyltransferase n=1 Tax=Actinacidiphila acidipaludis TaxID=2873382 RepID=A0ABS7QE58_9ACTN|nr:GNAT family N-acetyltransferase [Streptomyces acidipaludis]MBY8881456.1 GNAT family N-acetyltransferase [Streptomyces acidipaludis]
MNADVRTRIRPVAEGDWAGITTLENRAYAPLGLSEEPAALRSRARSSPATCFVLDVGPRLAGYLLALPYPESAFPDLARAEETVFRSRNLHLHDLVVAEDLRGRGLGRRLLRHLTETARSAGYEEISLVAVGGSDTFWSANGFTARDERVPGDGYGVDPVYMSRPVLPDRAGEPHPASGPPRGWSTQHEVG